MRMVRTDAGHVRVALVHDFRTATRRDSGLTGMSNVEAW
jgi:hypothetical protein